MTITKFTAPVTIEYLSKGEWYFWKHAPSRRVAELEIAQRPNKKSICRIVSGVKNSPDNISDWCDDSDPEVED